MCDTTTTTTHTHTYHYFPKEERGLGSDAFCECGAHEWVKLFVGNYHLAGLYAWVAHWQCYCHVQRASNFVREVWVSWRHADLKACCGAHVTFILHTEHLHMFAPSSYQECYLLFHIISCHF